MITVVIPTCNRPTELNTLLDALLKQDVSIDQVIIVDSSDQVTDLGVAKIGQSNLHHLTVGVKSAAIQRNIGIENVVENCKFLCFLDDDVIPGPSYVSKLVYGLESNGGCGISGIAINPQSHAEFRTRPQDAFGAIQRFFGLDSLRDGKLLRSGVNIPVRDYSGSIRRVDWLIGCSIWDFKKIKLLRFEGDFMGASLSEDVIFSVRASKFGELLVDPSTHLWHTESDIGRQKGATFWEMWVVNRKRLVEVMSIKTPNFFYFHLANFGQFLSLIYSGIRDKTLPDVAFLGIIRGYRQIFSEKRFK